MVRVLPPAGFGEGYEDAYFDSSEFVITAKRIAARRSFFDDEPGLGRLVFVFHLHGRRVLELAGQRFELNGPAFAVYYQAHGVPKRSTWAEGDRETAVVVGFSPEDPPAVLRGPAGFSAIWPSSFAVPDEGAVLIRENLSLEMEQAARLILAPKVHPSLMSRFLVTKANELLCLGFDAMLGTLKGREDAPDAVLGAKVQEARTIIDARLQSVPSIAELARSVNLSAAALSAGFWTAYGCGVPEYVLERRMSRAEHLLASSELPLKQIAYEVGYNHTSNFCAAFKRRFGRTPRRLRLSSRADSATRPDPHITEFERA